MAELRDLLARMGFVDARSLLQTGNLVFRGEGRTGGRLERMLETEAAQRLGLETDFFVRTAKEWKAVVARNPFPKEAERDPAHLVVMFLKEPPRPRMSRRCGPRSRAQRSSGPPACTPTSPTRTASAARG